MRSSIDGRAEIAEHTIIWTRPGIEDFLVRQKTERIMDKELHQ